MVAGNVSIAIVGVVAFEFGRHASLTRAAHVTSNEFVGVKTSTPIWVTVVPLTAVASGITNSKVSIDAVDIGKVHEFDVPGVVFSLAGTAHILSIEGWSVIPAAVLLHADIPVATITTNINGRCIGVSTYESTIASAAHVFGLEVPGVPPSAGI